jgi:uncharacterized protein (DUF2236 family)
MAASVLPSSQEIPSLVPRPGSVVWRYAGDARILATAEYALVLQVAHPTVGAGVREHSNYASDPWGRLLRTLDYSYLMVYGGPDAAAATGRWVREMHKRIKGITAAGRRYSALEPEAYAWVHATLAEAIVTGHRHFGTPLRADEVERFWSEWRSLGRLLGLREKDLPHGWSAFRAYFERMVEERLEHTDAVRDLFSALARPARPPIPLLSEPSWRVARIPIVRLISLATVGLLPSLLRERFGLRWTGRQELVLRALAKASRSATPVMPDRLRNVGPDYLRRRQEEIARSYLAAEPQAIRRLGSAA